MIDYGSGIRDGTYYCQHSLQHALPLGQGRTLSECQGLCIFRKGLGCCLRILDREKIVMKDNSRKHIRIKMHTQVCVEVEAPPLNSEKGGKLVHCDVIDVSFSGLSVDIDRELIVGSILSLSAELPSMEKPFYLVGKVMWCRSAVNDQQVGWTAGFHLMTARDSDIATWKELLEYV
jgi:hypothetical protein